MGPHQESNSRSLEVKVKTDKFHDFHKEQIFTSDQTLVFSEVKHQEFKIQET